VSFPRPLLVIGGAFAPAGKERMDQAWERGLDVCLADTATNLAKLDQVVKLAQKTCTLQYNDVGACTPWAKEQGVHHDFLGVSGYHEMAMESTARLRMPRAAGPGQNDRPASAGQSGLPRGASRVGIPAVPSATVQEAEDVRSFIADHPPGPWGIKLRSAQGGVGVS
jgi:hypothetical protein